MKVIPVINCTDFDCVKSKIQIAQEFLLDHGSENRSAAPEGWVHIDIADGGFTGGYATWRNPEDLKNFKRDPNLKIEAHLMLTEPELALEAWLAAGVSRIIVHLEAVEAIDTVVNICESKGADVWLALSPATPAEKAFPYLGLVKGCQVLAVTPGLPAQTMVEGTLDKIRAIRQAFPALPIEVDGGITIETIAQCKATGATQVVAGTAIFGAEDPAAAYRALSEVV